jgi:hypothetical protein
MLWVGMYLGLLVPGPSAVNSVWTFLFPFTMVTVAFAASQTMPAWLGFIAEVNPLSATIYATRGLFGNPGADGTSFVAQNAVLLAVAWPLLIIAIFAPLAVARYRSLSR